MKQKRKRFLGILFSLALVLGLMPGMSLTAYADDNPPYAQYNNTTTEITFDGKPWYLIDYDAYTVMLLAKECVGASKYNESGSFVEYSSNPTVKTVVDNWYSTNITADAKKAVSDNAMFLLTTAQANTIYHANSNVLKCSQASGAQENRWWLRSPGDRYDKAAFVDGGSGYVFVDGLIVRNEFGVRPALQLNLSSVIFESGSKTFSLKPYSVTLSGGANATTRGGATSQTGLTGAMTTVTYTANTGYYFAEFDDISSNGITARRTSSTVVTVSGTPTADAAITVPNAVEKTAATVKKAPTAKTLTYTGSAQDLVTAGEATGGTMQYALGNDATTAPTSGWSKSIPTGTDVKTYFVWYKVIGDSNHNDISPKCIQVTISEQSQNSGNSGNGGNQGGNGASENASATDNTSSNTSDNITVENSESSKETKTENVDKKQKSTKLSKLKAGKKSLNVTWNKVTAKGIKGYEIQYSTNKSFKEDATKTVSINKTKTTSKTIKKLKSKTKYYVRIRTFTKKNGEKVYSKWSKTKNVKVK